MSKPARKVASQESEPPAKPARRKVRLTANGVGLHQAFSREKLKAGSEIVVDHADILIQRGLAVEV